jgi:hypothetical protein
MVGHGAARGEVAGGGLGGAADAPGFPRIPRNTYS